MKRASVPSLVRQLNVETSDTELLELYTRQRSDAAFELLVSRYARLVWGQCRNLLANEADAEDAFQATFLVLSRSAQSVRSGAPLGPWLHGVAFRVCQNARRGAARRARHEGASARPEANRPVADSTWEAAYAAVCEEVQELPESQRAAFVLCGLEGRTESEAAAALGQKVGTISSRLARAKRTLLGRLARRGFGPGAAVLGALAGSSGSAPAAVTARALAILTDSGIPGSVQSLTRGVMGTGFVRFKLLAVGGLLAAGLVAGAASGWFRTPPDPPVKKASEGGPVPGSGVARTAVLQFKVGHPVACFAISHDGKTVALGGPEKKAEPPDIYQPGRCTLVDAASGAVLLVIKTERAAESLAFSPDGSRVLIGELNRSRLVPAGRTGSVVTRVWDTKSGTAVLELDGHMDMVRGAAYFPDGARMVTSSADGTARIWSAGTGKELLLLRTGAFNNGVTVSPDGKRVLIGNDATKFVVWSAETGKAEATVTTKYSASNATFSPNGAVVAVCGWGIDDITLWDSRTGEPKGNIVVGFDAKKKVPIASNVTSNLAFSPDGKWLATGNGHLSDDDEAGEVTVWDVEGRKKGSAFKGHKARVVRVGFTPDGKSIISCSADGTVIVRDFKPVGEK